MLEVVEPDQVSVLKAEIGGAPAKDTELIDMLVDEAVEDIEFIKIVIIDGSAAEAFLGHESGHESTRLLCYAQTQQRTTRNLHLSKL